jgi:PAS domain S-box-containing protein
VALTGSNQHPQMPEPDRTPSSNSEVPEVIVLRRAMRDLLALCTIPAAWVGREPDAIAKGVVDVLVSALRVECGYLMLPGGATKIDVMQGNVPPEVIENLLLACSGELPRAPIVHELRNSYRAAIVPITVASKSGMVAAISSRLDFPTETESMLMSVAANQAAISLEEAHLLQDRIRGERALEGSSKREAQLRAEADLERHRLQELVAQAPAAIGLMHGPEHRWTYVNDYYVRITGRNTPADFLGKTLEESLPETETQVFRKLLDEVYQTGNPYVGREMKATLNRMEQPSVGYFDFVYQPLRTAAGQVEGVLVHAVEVTDKVLARKAIAESEERLRLAQSAARIGTWEWNAVNDLWSLSPELHEMFATNAADPAHAKIWAERVHPEDWEQVQRLMNDGYRQGEMELEYRYQGPELGTRWFYCKGRRSEGETRMLGVVQDVTERKMADEAIRKNQERLQTALMASQRLAAIVDSSDDAIVSKDLTGIVTSWNACAERTFGYTAEEMIGKSIINIIPPELHEDERRILATIARGERIEHFETVRMKKNGERIDVSLTISPVKDEQGNVIGAAKIARDITQRKKTERALQLTEKLASVGRLAATVAHELNNPLEAVTNFIFLAQTTEDLPPTAKEYLTLADRELERVSHIAQQTLGFYRDTSALTGVDMRASIDDVLRVFQSKLRYKSLQIELDIQPGLKVEAHHGEIRQVFSNLISNAIDASQKGGVIKIHGKTVVKNGDPCAQITFADSGCGIPEPLRPSIFNPFFTTKSDVGTGLGLWVSKSLVEKHGGHIAFRTAVGKGTVFCVQFPLSVSFSKESRRATA